MHISAITIAESSAISDGFKTAVQPDAIQGPSFETIWLINQFHGVIRPHIPIGSGG